MKGIIFNVFNQLIETKWGLEMWEDLLEETRPASEGLYTSAGTYPDEELINMAVALSEKSGIPVSDLVFSFGEYLLHQLAVLYPSFFEGKTAKDFLLSVHDYIHVEVKKLYPMAELPNIEYEDPAEDKLVMIYTSKRKLYKLAEGMIHATSNYYKIKITNHIVYDPEVSPETCKFELSFG